MRQMKKKSSLLFSTLFFFCAPSWAAFSSHLPLTDQEMARYRFPQQSIPMFSPENRDLRSNFLQPDGSLKIWHLTAGMDGVSARPIYEADAENLLYSPWIFSGVDRQGRPWNVYTGSLFNIAGQSRLFVADLDGNGITDIIVWTPIAANGMGPTSCIDIITFDQQARPIYFADCGFYRADENGVEDLLDINRNAHAELLTMHFSDGYWISNLYRPSDGRWSRMIGKQGRLDYPVLTRFTHRPNRTAVKHIIDGRSPDIERDLSNHRALNNACYVLADTSGKKYIECGTSVVLELVDALFIIIDENDESRTINPPDNAAFFDRLFQQQRPVKLYGIDNRYPKPNPHTLWALPTMASE